MHVFMWPYKLVYTHNRSKDTSHFLLHNGFENVHSLSLLRNSTETLPTQATVCLVRYGLFS